MSFKQIKWPHKRRQGRYVQHPRLGTRLISLGEDMRTRLSAGPIDASPAERAVYGWLQRFGISFDFQRPIMGGRRIPGGAVVDFLIFVTHPPTVLRVMSYWHTSPSERAIDDLQKSIIEEDGYYRVIDIWEWETMDYDMMSRRLEEIIFGNVLSLIGADVSRLIPKRAYEMPPIWWTCKYRDELVLISMDKECFGYSL